MLEETYLKFKKNILPKMKKMQPNFQEPVVEYCEPEQVIDICSYNHYPILDCGLTPYYGSPTYVYLRMGMGMSCSPALWQQFVHIIWEQLPNKERYKIIMDDILIFSGENNIGRTWKIFSMF